MNRILAGHVLWKCPVPIIVPVASRARPPREWQVNGEGITHVLLVINAGSSDRPCGGTVTTFALPCPVG